MSAVVDMSGAKLPGVTCVGPASARGVWVWQCDCGNQFERRGAGVRLAIKQRGKTSCGCLHTETSARNGRRNRTHGWSADQPKLYDIFKQMHRRCINPKSKDYRDYGARGIRVCEEWQDIDAFCRWALASGYRSGLSIDRIDSNGNYEVGNCRWVALEKQAANTRKNLFITHNEETLHLQEWARRTGIHFQTIRQRIRAGWNAADALTIPPERGRNQTFRSGAG